MKRIINETKEMLWESKYSILIFIIMIAAININLPYYIYIPGGITNINDRYEINGSYKSEGTFNMIYVGELKANVFTYINALIMPSWELVKYEDVVIENEDAIDEANRSDMYMVESNQNAIINAYKKANKTYEIINTKYKVFYILEEAKTDLKVGDELIKIDNILVSSYKDTNEYIITKNIDDEVIIKIKRNNKTKTVKATVMEYEDEKIIGISMFPIYEFKTNPKISYKFNSDESGPSAGLILTLSIYDSLIKEDITRGYKIAGTGTIDEQGNIGAIGQVEKKLASAVNGKAEIFFVPSDNYNDAKKLAMSKRYDIRVISVKTIEDAINYLNELEFKI